MLLGDGRTVLITFIDHTDENHQTEIRTKTTSFGSAAARDVFDAMTTGTILNLIRLTYLELAASSTGNTAPTDPLSQGEVMWQVNYTDNTTLLKHRWFIPTADLSLLPAGQEQLDIVSPGPPKDLKDWLEANARSDVNNLITVDSIEKA